MIHRSELSNEVQPVKYILIFVEFGFDFFYSHCTLLVETKYNGIQYKIKLEKSAQ